MKVLVVAPHPDDEVLGVGGTIAGLACKDNQLTVAIVTKGWEPLFPNSQVEQVRSEAEQANKILGVQSLRFMDLPVTRLNQIPKNELNGAFEKLIAEEKPEIVFLPFCGDLQQDHRQVFEACMVALRPGENTKSIMQILCYETVSETHRPSARIEAGFEPNLWVDISSRLPVKLEAMRKYKSQLQSEPAPRSLEAISSLAKWRGSTVGMHAAECFVTIRQFWQTL